MKIKKILAKSISISLLFLIIIFISCIPQKQSNCYKEFDEKILVLSEFARGTKTHKIDSIVDNYRFLSEKTGKWGKLNIVSRGILYDSLPVFIQDSIEWRNWYKKKCNQ